jgi:hypothetical protein
MATASRPPERIRLTASRARSGVAQQRSRPSAPSVLASRSSLPASQVRAYVPRSTSSQAVRATPGPLSRMRESGRRPSDTSPLRRREASPSQSIFPALSPGGAQEGASEVDDGQAVREDAVLQATDGRPAHQGAAGGGEDVNADGAARSGRRPPLPEGALRGASVGGPWGLGRSPVLHRTQVAIRSPGRSAVRQTEQLVDT